MLRSISVYRHAVVNTPVARWALIARGTAYSKPFPCTQRRRPSPSMRKVGDHIGLFEACSTFTGYYGLSARRVAYSDPFVSKAPTVSFPPRVASIATGWSDPDAGWELHPLKINTLHGSRRTQCLSFPLRRRPGNRRYAPN